MTRRQYEQLPNEKRTLYNMSAEVLCLLVRKEFGQDKFHEFILGCSEENPEKAIQEILGFQNYGHLDRTLKRYMIDISRDLKNGTTPDWYLQINPEIEKALYLDN